MKPLMVFAGYVAISGWKRFYKIQKSRPWYNLFQWRLTQEVSAKKKMLNGKLALRHAHFEVTPRTFLAHLK